MVHYLRYLKNIDMNAANNSDKPFILVSIGDIAFEVGSSISPYMTLILDNIREGLRTKFKVRKQFEKDLFYCIGKLACALGPAFAKHLNKDLLNLMLNCPMSDHMQETLMILNEKIPSLESTVNSRILNLLSISLSGEKFIQSNQYDFNNQFSIEKARKSRNQSFMKKTGESNDDITDAQILIQCFKMLQLIHHQYSLTEFVRLITISYIEHEDSSVRKLAALTSCDLFIKDDICKQTSVHALHSVSEVLSKLLMIAITDPVADIDWKFFSIWGQILILNWRNQTIYAYFSWR